VDCSVTFYGNDYAQHITCVSEAEKYEKSLYKPKVGKANPQEAWNDLIQTACGNAATAPQIVRPYLQRVGELNNVPRNKKKFINFAKNSLRLYSDNVLEALWTYLDTYREDLKKEAEAKPVEAAKEEKPAMKSSKKDSGEGKKEAAPSAAEVVTEPAESDEERAKKEKKKMKKEKRKREEEEAAAAAVVVEAEVVEEVQKEKKKKSKKDKSS
jgi:cell growth-regulating nucleolar protein